MASTTPEPLSPIAAGVASVLKSLRTRAGLQESRLSGTELALDTLTGLEPVREFVAAGEPVERAIVRAVAAAAGSLEPTDSIVADVSLGLGLFADAAPDPDLYARDLDTRRDALVKHWALLHELRQAPTSEPAPRKRALRLEIETSALSALAVALTGGRRVATVTANVFPTTATRARLGEDAAGRGAGSRSPIPLAEEPRRDTPASAPPLIVHTQAPLLLAEFQRISQALRAALARNAGPPGWAHDLRKGSRVTALSSSFGLKALLLIEGFLARDLVPVAEELARSSSPEGGYAARNQVRPRPEVTAAVLGTLHRVNGTADYERQIATIRSGIGDFERTRPFILATALEAIAQLGCDLGLARSLTIDLLAARHSYGNVLLWAEKAERDLVSPAPSVAHTARAVFALTRFQALRPADPSDELACEVQAAVEQAAGWLTIQQNLENVSELIDRQLADNAETVYIRHFTSAWVVKSLVSVGLPATHPAVSQAVARMWRDYSIKAALWSWRNGDLPVWMTLDAVEALRMVALAGTLRTGGLDGP